MPSTGHGSQREERVGRLQLVMVGVVAGGGVSVWVKGNTCTHHVWVPAECTSTRGPPLTHGSRWRAPPQEEVGRTPWVRCLMAEVSCGRSSQSFVLGWVRSWAADPTSPLDPCECDKHNACGTLSRADTGPPPPPAPPSKARASYRRCACGGGASLAAHSPRQLTGDADIRPPPALRC